jgi:hypothetical protein
MFIYIYMHIYIKFRGAIRVWKTIGQVEVNVPTLDEIIRKDARRGIYMYIYVHVYTICVYV